MAIDSQGTGSEPEDPDLPERWSAKRKREILLRLLRGEPLDQVSRDTQVPAHQVEDWQRRFLDAGQRGLRSRRDPEARERTLAKAKLGERTLRLELAEGLIENRGFADEWKRRKG